MYFVGSGTGATLDAARGQSQNNAYINAVSYAQGHGVKGASPAQRLATIRSSSTVSDTFGTYNASQRVFNYYTRIIVPAGFLH